ncbi:MAG: hypothetical protein WC841_01830 [Candidatus Shapirobacteria bacterium]|jgi:hypothetical protein
MNIKKIAKFVPLFFFNLLAVFYLIAPLPAIPDLSNSAKSDEPGDTTQLQNVAGYYTNLSRTEVINFYKANYNGFFRIQINHPPEKAKQIIRDTIQSYYLEEFILPFRESLFVNGFEWKNDVFTKPEKRIANRLLFKGIEYQAKITTKTFPVPILNRLVSFFFIETVVIILLKIYSGFIFKKRHA